MEALEPLEPVEVEGQADQNACLISWGHPEAPHDPKRTANYRKRNNLPPVDANAPLEPTQQQQYIASFIPLRVWQDEDGVEWQQAASSSPAIRLEVVQLQEKLRRLLQERGARMTGICPIRRALFDECFDEVIRQVVAGGALEMGLLLLRVRNERWKSLYAYRGVFESRAAYSFRVAIKGEEQMLKKRGMITDVEAELAALNAELEETNGKMAEQARIHDEKSKEDEKRFSEELNTLKKENTAKKQQLENLCTIHKR